MMQKIGKKTGATERRHWITFQQKASIPDGEGGFVDSWVDFLSVFAAVYPFTADQKFNYKTVDVDATHRIKTAGYLQLPDATKWVGNTWAVTWSGIDGATVQIHYQINSGSWVEISASEENTGLYNWIIPAAAIGRLVVVRVMHATDTTSYSLTDYYIIVAAVIVDRSVNESDRVSFDGRFFEILTIEDVQERHFEKWLTCKERR